MTRRDTSHIVKSFDENLSDLTRLLAELGAHVEAMLKDAISALTTSNKALAEDVVARDALANALEVQINDDALRLIALRQPMALDLRRIIGTMKIAGDLERIGDLSSSLAKRSLIMDTDHALSMTGGSKSMGLQVTRQLAGALDAHLKDDKLAALQVWISDADTDAMHDTLLAETLDIMTKDPRRITSGTHLLFAAKHLERVGDHTSNIAEITYYIVTGDPLRRGGAPSQNAQVIDKDTAQ